MAMCIKYYAPEFVWRIEKLASIILTNCKKGDELRLFLTGIKKFSKWYFPSDTINLSKKIAEMAIEMGKYPFGIV